MPIEGIGYFVCINGPVETIPLVRGLEVPIYFAISISRFEVYSMRIISYSKGEPD